MQYRYHRNDRQRVRRAACGGAGVRSCCWCGGCGRCGCGGVRRSHGDDARDADHRPRYRDLCGPARRRQGGLRGQAPGAPAGVRQAGPDGPGVHGAGVHRRGGADQRRGRPAARGLFWRLPAAAVLRGACPCHAFCGAAAGIAVAVLQLASGAIGFSGAFFGCVPVAGVLLAHASSGLAVPYGHERHECS